LEFSASNIVHFVTNDSAFYDSRDRLEIVTPLKNELEILRRDVRLYQTTYAFLAAVSQNEITIIEKNTICDAIVDVVTPKALEIASERASGDSGHIGTIKRFELSAAQNSLSKDTRHQNRPSSP
jgi:hypothetical protein